MEAFFIITILLNWVRVVKKLFLGNLYKNCLCGKQSRNLPVKITGVLKPDSPEVINKHSSRF
jgi:hypothetical protein